MLKSIRKLYKDWKESKEETKRDIKSLTSFIVLFLMVLAAATFAYHEEPLGPRENETCVETNQSIKYNNSLYQVYNCEYKKLKRD